MAALHQRIANQRRTFLHQTSAQLIALIGWLVTERLAIQSMTANGGRRQRGLNREILSTAPALLLQMLRYKAEEAGSHVGEAYARRLKPSQTCHRCGRQVKKTLADRVHRCPCGVVCGRHENSALVLLHDALTSQELAGCGVAVKVASVKHETPPKARAWVE